MGTTFSLTARYYDRIYARKDYAGEVERLRGLIAERCPDARTLLDVACGTGMHLVHLKEGYQVQGLDVCAELLEVARARLPGVPFHCADMTEFDLGQELDVVTCLFSSIGYLTTLDRVRQAVRCMARHLRPGGVLVVEPWFTPDQWHPGTVHGLYIDDPDLKIARINSSFVEGRVSIFDLHHLIGTPEETQHVVEHHELGLYETEELRAVLEETGLLVDHDKEGLIGRGLVFGVKRAAGSRES